MPIASFAAFVALLLVAYPSGKALGFGFDDVAQRARDLAASPYKLQEDKFPKELQNLTYDQYRDIRFKPDRALWRANKLPFEVAFFHEGLYFKQRVRINELGPGGAVREIRFSPDFFDYGSNKLDPQALRDLADIYERQLHCSVSGQSSKQMR